MRTLAALKQKYTQKRIHHWNLESDFRTKPKNNYSEYYHKLLRQYYQHYIPKGLRVLELGCGHGKLLAAVEPQFGVGVDFSEKMIRQASLHHPDLHFIVGDVHELPFSKPFDIIVISDLVNDLWDVQALFQNLHALCHSGTRLVINFDNKLWRLPLSLAKKMNLGANVLEQNWLSPQDMKNLLTLSDFETIQRKSVILFPLFVKFLSIFLNRFMAKLPPFSWLTMSNMVVARPLPPPKPPSEPAQPPSVSVIIAARNEAGHIDDIMQRVPMMGENTEIIFVEGNSTDSTYETIEQVIEKYPHIRTQLHKQPGKGKGDAVRLGFNKANNDILMILDADMTVPPEDLPRFYEAIASGKGEFINGVRLVYPMEDQAMRFFNIIGNKFFSLAFTWLLGQPIKDTLCGTKVIMKKDYQNLAANRSYFGDFDPFGDFDLIFGAAKLNLKIVEIPIRYKSRAYGETNINRWRHGWLLLKMVVFAAKRIKFV